MKKFLTMILIFMLMFGFTACGGNDDTPADDAAGMEQGVVDGDGETDGDEGGESDETVGAGDVLNPDDLYMGDGQDYELEGEYDFQYTVSSEFGMSGILKKLDYSDYEGMEAILQTRMEDAVAGSVGGVYDIFTSYEPEEGSEIDLLTCAAAMENGDAEGIYFEGGAYHVVGESNYQYISCYSQNFVEVSKANTESIMNLAKKTLGLELDQKNLHTAIETAFGTAVKNLDEYTLLEEEYTSGNGFDEIIRIAVIGSVTEDDEVSYYAYFERERCYE